MSACEWGPRDVMDEKIGPDDLNLKGTCVIYKGREDMGGNAGPLPHAGLKVHGARKNDHVLCTGQDKI